MLGTIIPLFKKNMTVKALCIAAQSENALLRPQIGLESASGEIPGVDILDTMEMGFLETDEDITFKMDGVMLFCEIPARLMDFRDRIVFVLDSKIPASENVIRRIRELKAIGFRFAIYKRDTDKFNEYKELASLCQYMFIDVNSINPLEEAKFYRRNMPSLELAAIRIARMKELQRLLQLDIFDYFSGSVFNMPVSDKKGVLSPVKANYLHLLQTINEPDFDLVKAADVIGRDTALVFSMLKMASNRATNSPVTSIRHAVAMLGQKELKSWMSGYIAKEIMEDKPSAIMLLVMLRAKFAENLASQFGLENRSSELFLMGLMSLLDVMLDMPMEEALEKVSIASSIKDALLTEEGDLAEVLFFIEEYETASWQEVSRIMLLKSMDEKVVFESYLDAMTWYKGFF